MIFQEPTTSLNPCFTIGYQLVETLRLHLPLDRARRAGAARSSCWSRSASRRPPARMNDYPHQLSGGMNQRVMIAMAIACNPRLLIADEPTTALDVTIQAQILDLLRSLQRERGMALVLITHNMGVVPEMAQRVAVMYAGQVMEQQRGRRAVRRARSIPTPRRCSRRCPSTARSASGWPPFPAWCPACSTVPPAACSRRAAPMPPRTRAACGPELRAWQGGQVRCHYPLGDPQRDAARAQRRRRAARRWPNERGGRRGHGPAPGLPRSAAACSARRRSCRPWAASRSRIEPGRTLAVVGESGCGKSTLARMVALIEKPTAGSARARRHRRRARRRRPSAAHLRQAVQLVFQNPYGSLNPRKKIGAVLEAPLAINTDLPAGRARRARARDAGAGRPAPRACQPLSAHVLGRPAPAHRHRARADAAARSCWWPTSRCPRSTCRSRRRC